MGNHYSLYNLTGKPVHFHKLLGNRLNAINTVCFNLSLTKAFDWIYNRTGFPVVYMREGFTNLIPNQFGYFSKIRLLRHNSRAF